MGIYRLVHPQSGFVGDEQMPVEVRCFPKTDERSRAVVEALVASWADGPLTAESMRLRLSMTYPDVRIESQTQHGSLTSQPVLYVYRDGHP